MLYLNLPGSMHLTTSNYIKFNLIFFLNSFILLNTSCTGVLEGPQYFQLLEIHDYFNISWQFDFTKCDIKEDA